MQKKNKIRFNNFVKFLDNKRIREIKVKIEKLKNVDICYGIVQLFTNNINYLPMAYQFKYDDIERKKIEGKETFSLKNPFFNNKSGKKYTAFIFSIVSYNYHEYDVQITENNRRPLDDDDDDDDDDEKSHVLGIILAAVGALLLFAMIGIVIYYQIKNCKPKEGEYTTYENDENENEKNDNNNYNETNQNSINSTDYNNNIDNNNDNNDNNNLDNNINNINKNSKYNKIYRFDDEEDEDKRLYKNLDED